MKWTDERVAELKKMWLAGDSASDCAKALGITRNAAIGKVYRLGLTSDGHRGGPSPKLSAEKQAYIIATLSARRPTQYDLAAELGVSQGTISNVWRRHKGSA